MKVTKAKALNATPFMRSACWGTPTQRATWKPCGTSSLPRTRRRGPRRASPAQIRWTLGQSAARARRANCRFGPRRWLQVARRAGRARRGERAERCCIQPLCFGDFHLRPQMFAKRGSAHFAQRSYADTKVTRLPGRDPASNAKSKPSKKQTRNDCPRTDAPSRSPLRPDRFTHRTSRAARWSD